MCGIQWRRERVDIVQGRNNQQGETDLNVGNIPNEKKAKGKFFLLVGCRHAIINPNDSLSIPVVFFFFPVVFLF